MDERSNGPRLALVQLAAAVTISLPLALLPARDSAATIDPGTYVHPAIASAAAPTPIATWYALFPLVGRDYPSTPATPTPTATPVSACPGSSANVYFSGPAQQVDADNPVRPAWNNADKNIKLRAYVLNTDAAVQRELVRYATDDLLAPQFATTFSPARVPALAVFYQVNSWNWGPDSTTPGTRGAPLTTYRVTALGLATTPGEQLHVPASGYTIGGNPEMEVTVLFADVSTIALKYGRQDSPYGGYILHLDNICTDPNLLTLYNALDASTGPRYVYAGGADYWYPLPNLASGQVLGTARGTEAVVAIADFGSFMDPRSCTEWWIVRPGYSGSCPWHN